MARDSKYFTTIENLMDVGYVAKDIPKMTGIPKSTVYRVVNKLREEAKFDFKELMEKDYLYKYQQNLEGLDKTIVWCNEEMVKVNEKYDELGTTTQEALDQVEVTKHISKAHLISNLIAVQTNRVKELSLLVMQRDKAVNDKATLYNKGPVVYRVNEYVEHKLQNIPAMLQENKSEVTAEEAIPEVTKQDITPEDQEILDDMEKDLDFNTSESNDEGT